MNSYSNFIAAKSQIDNMSGFDPVWMPDFLFDFQRHLVEWSIRKGRAAIFADCGLGKTPMQLVWAQNVVQKSNGRVLILTPLAVGQQTIQEAGKFGIDAVRSRDGKFMADDRIVISNYQQIDKFDPLDFEGVVCDESSILKNFNGKTKAQITEFMRTRPYRLLCTATAAPNDFVELGTSSEALGELGFQDMVTKFFKKQTSKDHLGWGRTKYEMKGHAKEGFWRWVCSWARAIRKPSDLGYSDEKFVIPPMTSKEWVIKAKTKRADVLFDMPAVTLEEQREERRRTIPERCEKVAQLVNKTKQPAVVWCHLNEEGDMLERLISDSVQVSGADDDDTKEERFTAFADCEIRVLVTKPQIAGFGLNWQHCSHQTFFPSHSFEQWYQSIRRCVRFGQKRSVHVDVVTSEGEEGVVANLQRKQESAEEMFSLMTELMGNELRIKKENRFKVKEQVPSWLRN